MSIVATLPVFILSNPYALNGLLRKDRLYHLNHDRRREEDWEEWVKLASTMRDSTRPGHVFDMRWKKLKQDKGISLTEALDCLGKEFLNVHNQRLYIGKTSQFSYWQNLRGRMAMLPVKCWMLYQHGLSMRDFLVHPQDAILDEYIDNEGLNEAHLHLNACYRPETFWLKDINNISSFEHRELIRHSCNKSQREAYATIHPELEPDELAGRVRLAHILRRYLLHIIDTDDVKDLVEEMRRSYQEIVHYPNMPLIRGISSRIVSDVSSYQREELRLWRGIFSKICNLKPYWQEIQFYAHLYLLIQNEYLNLYRHHENQRGFSAFHVKSTHATPHIQEELYYRSIFRELFRCTDAKPTTCIELRLRPDAFIHWGSYLLKWWKEEWNNHRKNKIGYLSTFAQDEEWVERKSKYSGAPQPIFVLHFIKSHKGMVHVNGNRSVPSGCEPYAVKRKELARECNRLSQFVNIFCSRHHTSVGIDAASDELQLPAEVLAPVFRQFERQTGISHRTYHCGEDFYHLIGGIRAVYDAVEFLDMQCGHRLGHATAIGIHPEQWGRHMPQVFCMKQGDYLLDLIFAWVLFGEQDLKVRARLESRMISLAQTIFSDQSINGNLLQGFYKGRHLLPERIRAFLDDEHAFVSYDEEDKLVEKHCKEWGRRSLELLQIWNYCPRVQYKKIEITEESRDFLDDMSLIKLQQAVQKIICERNIVLETLPVSNLRISQYDDIRQHHLLRWLMVPGRVVPGDYPMTVCMGSDDPGIFVTDVKNEYYHVFSNLRQAGLSPAECMVYIRQINEAGRVYAFRAPLPAIL